MTNYPLKNVVLTAFFVVILVVLSTSSDEVAMADNSTNNYSFSENLTYFITQSSKFALFQDRIQRIDNYFTKYKMPLAGSGAKFVEVADKYDLDWRLLPAISVQESTGGKHMCYNNPFGWGSCKIKFDSTDEAIEELALNLSGNDATTSGYYKGKNAEKILWAYNGTVNPAYPGQVLNIMKKF